MADWSNWSGKITAQPERLHFARSEEDLAALVRQAATAKQRIRVAGATHSHAPLVQHEGIIVVCDGLSGVIDTDAARQQAWVRAGTRIYALGQALHQAGLGLPNQGDIDQQAIAGATGTGTHGTGATLRNLSAAVIGAQLILSNGDTVTCSASENSDLWQASRLHLGALGIITRLHLQCRPAYKLIERSFRVPLEDVLSRIDEHTQQNRHFEFFWYPQSDQAQAKAINETDHAAEYPVADEGQRCAYSYEVLPNHRPHKHTEMEYSVPAAQGPQCLREIARLLRQRFPEVRWPVEYRTLAADDVWLSSAYERDTVTISVHQDIAVDDTPYFQACEEVFLNFGGRPHWGKVNYLDGDTLASIHPRWQAWWQVRDHHDPHNLFLNPYLQGLRDGP